MSVVPELRIERVRDSRLAQVEDWARLPFASVFADHMLVAEYHDGEWQQACIRPYGPLMLPPTISALQYGISVFEGLKAQRTATGAVALFRAQENARRLNSSAARLVMPPVPEQLFLHGLRELLRLDQSWVPPSGQGALYLRPCLFSIDESIRVKPAERYLFTVSAFPFGAYYSAPVDALTSSSDVRAFPGGTGAAKVAGSYAAALRADESARAQGFDTTLWLDAREHAYVEECGVMNMFFVIGDEIVTPSLDGTILPGITRDSVIVLLRDMGRVVQERRIAIAEIIAAHERGVLHECFGTGTAATLTHLRRIRHNGHDIELPAISEQGVGAVVRAKLNAIATAREPDVHGWLDIV